jgi:hypothetical protein
MHEIPDTAPPREVAAALYTTEAGLAQMRYRGTGPRFVKVGHRVLYRWSDVHDYLKQNTLQRTDDPRGELDRKSVVRSRMAALGSGGDDAA